MKELKLLLKTFVLLLFVSSIVSCGGEDEMPDPDPETPETITEIAAADAQFSTLVTALTRVGLDATLDGSGTFTVFAPTNDAFTAAGINLDDLTDEELTNVLLYHVLGTKALAADLPLGQSYNSTLSNSGPDDAALSLLIEVGGQVEINSSAIVTTADVEATNGVIHIIDKVLLPMNIVDHAVANTNLQTLVNALGDASGDLVNVLNGAGPFTVFAPTNGGFINLNSNLTNDELRDVLLYHVLGEAAPASDFSELFNYRTTASASGPDGAALSMAIKNDGGSVSINGMANVTTANIVATNGIIHVVDVAFMPLNLVGQAALNPNFSELVGALATADGNLVDLLNGSDVFTVFAPVNTAFEAISDVVSGLSSSDLANVLTYHVVGGNIQSSALTDGMSVTAANEEKFTVNLGTDVTLTDANGNVSNVVLTDVQTTNGVIHVLDKVILP